MPKALVSDLHGDHDALIGVLTLIGALDEQGDKRPDWWLCQVGDLVHGPGAPPAPASKEDHNLLPRRMAQFRDKQAADLRTMMIGFRLFDLVLMGNHEFQFFGGPGFNGSDRSGDTLTGQSIRDFYRAGSIKAATHVGDWLVTHAGLQPAYWDEYDAINRDASELAAKLNDDLEAALASGIALPFEAKPPVFWSMGQRWQGPGRMPPGGVFWADWKELCAGYAKRWMDGAPDGALKQIVGHTPQEGPRKTSHYPLVCIDVGAGLNGRAAAAVTDDDGATWTTHVYDPRQ